MDVTLRVGFLGLSRIRIARRRRPGVDLPSISSLPQEIDSGGKGEADWDMVVKSRGWFQAAILRRETR